MKLKRQFRALKSGLSQAMHVRGKYGVSLRQQFRDLVALRRNNVGISDYYLYSIFDPKRHPSLKDKLTYSGWRVFGTEFRRFSEPRLQAIAYEKHILYRLLDTFGLPTPTIYALYAPQLNAFERHNAITTQQELIKFLTECDCLPLFGKPSNANEGFGGRGISQREPSGNLRLITNQVVTPKALAEDIHKISHRTGTYLLTEFLTNNDEIREICGDTVASIRIIMLVREGVPEFFRGSILFPMPESHVSNVRGFSTGSIACGLDLETGCIHTALRAAGPDREEVVNHPASGKQLVGRTIQHWDEVKALMMKASLAMSPFRMQHWDVALTKRGPVIMEMNFIGDVAACQIYGPPGLYSEQYLSFLASNTVW